MSDLFNEPLSDEERAEVAAMPSHELYLLENMLPVRSVRWREVHALYLECLSRMVCVASPRKDDAK